MNAFLKIFNEPYPLEEELRIQILTNGLIAFIVIIILALFEPFGLDKVNFQFAKVLSIYFGYGVVTFLICIMADRLIKPAFPMFFDEQNWTVLKNIGWVIFIITFVGVANLFYSNALGFTGVSGTSLLHFILYTVAVSTIPVTIITLIIRVRLLRKNLKQVEEINNQLQNPIAVPETELILTFLSDNDKDIIKLLPDQFLYAESADNYSDIVYIENGIIRRELIRCTLKRIEETNTIDFVHRVHRAYVVNLMQVKTVIGNSQGYRLVFENIEESIPVAKRSSDRVKSLLSIIHHK